MKKNKLCIFLLFSLFIAVLMGDDAEERMRIPIPRLTDPPPQVDGKGLRFANTPCKVNYDKEENVSYVYSGFKWGGVDDCSATVTFGWDAKCIYAFVVVKDDVLSQDNSNETLFRGDHVMLVFDFTPGGSKTNADIWRLGVTPGNFANTPASSYLWSPRGGTTDGVSYGCSKREDGYQLEICCPWTYFGFENAPSVGYSFGFDCIVGDSDTSLTQKSMLGLNGKLGSNTPELLPLAVLGHPDGEIPDTPKKSVPLTDEIIKLEKGGSYTIEIPDDYVGKYPTLSVDAILEFEKYGGATYALTLELNGVPLNLDQCINRDESIAFDKHNSSSLGSKYNWYCFYNSSFDATDFPEVYSAGNKIEPANFKFAVGKMLKKGEKNVLKIGYEPRPNMDNKLLVSVAMTEENTPALREESNGELGVYYPHALDNPPNYQWKLNDDGSIGIGLANRTFTITSAYSTRTPGWNILGNSDGEKWISCGKKGALAYYAESAEFIVKRSIAVTPFKMHITDEVINKIDEPLPLLYRHETSLAGLKNSRICGVRVSARGQGKGPVYSESEGPRPTTQLDYEGVSLGIVGEDDYTRAQGKNYVNGNMGGVGNDYFVIPAKGNANLEFSIYPLENDDEFVFINRIRNDWDVNFTMPFTGMLSYMRDNIHCGEALMRRNILGKLIPERDIFVSGGKHHGSLILDADLTELKESNKRIKELFPELSTHCYFHSFISQSKYDNEKLLCDAQIDASGKQNNYDKNTLEYPMFTPVEGREFAKRLEMSIEKRFEIGFDGIYWDERDRSNGIFDYNENYWDEHTAEIDPKTHRIVRRMSTVALLILPWNVKMVNRIMSRVDKRGFLSNGAPITKTMTKIHFPAFIETGTISNLRLGQLYTPLALGDHFTERTELDAYRHMLRSLDYGCVYHWYYYSVRATHPTLTHYMFPCTPIELGNGYIIAKERIVTRKSGYFGWNDKSNFTVHVFDATGNERPDITVPCVEINGANYAELRLPMGYSAAIVRE